MIDVKCHTANEPITNLAPIDIQIDRDVNAGVIIVNRPQTVHE